MPIILYELMVPTILCTINGHLHAVNNNDTSTLFMHLCFVLIYNNIQYIVHLHNT